MSKLTEYLKKQTNEEIKDIQEKIAQANALYERSYDGTQLSHSAVKSLSEYYCRMENPEICIGKLDNSLLSLCKYIEIVKQLADTYNTQNRLIEELESEIAELSKEK